MADANNQISQQNQQDVKAEAPAPAPAPTMMGAAVASVGPQVVLKKLAARKNAEESAEKGQADGADHGGGGGGDDHKPKAAGGNENQLADEIISQSRAMDLPFRAKMEKSFGTHFEGVKAHQSDRTHEIGAEAFVKGKDIVFATDHPDEGIVAH